LRKKPENIINGTSKGPESPRATFALGADADNKVPKAIDALATRITITTQMKNLSAHEFKLDIQ
jgi:hypothetical protein